MIKTSPDSKGVIKLYRLRNSLGTEIQILNLGATVFDFILNDKNDRNINITVGPKYPEDYLSKNYEEENRCFGASVGRYAGRISNGRFKLNDQIYKLHASRGVHLHGGLRGYQYKLWNLDVYDPENNEVTLSYLSKHGEEGYPGNLLIKVTYTLTEENEFVIVYTAKTDKATPVNITNHTYYNLNGEGSVKDHELEIASDEILEVDEKLRPSGSFISLNNHSKDFSISRPIGEQEVDDTFVLRKSSYPAVKLYAPQSGVELTVKTNQPSVVVYIPENLPQKWEYKNPIAEYPSVCIETQNFPDAPNHSNFPSAILNPGEEYRNYSSWKFKIK